MALYKMTDDSVFWACTCGKRNITPIEDVRVVATQVNLGLCECGTGTALLLAGKVPSGKMATDENIKRHVINQTLAKRVIALENVDKVPGTYSLDAATVMGKEWKAGDVMEVDLQDIFKFK